MTGADGSDSSVNALTNREMASRALRASSYLTKRTASNCVHRIVMGQPGARASSSPTSERIYGSFTTSD